MNRTWRRARSSLAGGGVKAAQATPGIRHRVHAPSVNLRALARGASDGPGEAPLVESAGQSRGHGAIARLSLPPSERSLYVLSASEGWITFHRFDPATRSRNL